MGEEAKITLAELREQRHFDIKAVARVAAVAPTDVLCALRGEPISKPAATAILTALSTQFRQQFTLDTVEIAIRDAAL